MAGGDHYNMRSYIKGRQVENHWYRLIRLREAEREERREVSALDLALDVTDFPVLFHVSRKHHTQTVVRLNVSKQTLLPPDIALTILPCAQPSLNHLLPSCLLVVQKGACGLALGFCPASLWWLDLCRLTQARVMGEEGTSFETMPA